MKIIKYLFNNIVSPLIVMILFSLILGVGSKLDTGDWIKWFVFIPKNIWIVIGIMFFLWIIIILRLKQIKKSKSGPSFYTITNPLYGWKNIGKLEYAGVLWRLRAPGPETFKNFDPSDVSPSDIEAEIPPRCPKCETELEQSNNFFGGYIWKCVNCGFEKKNKYSYYKESDRVEKIARRDWEKQNF